MCRWMAYSGEPVLAEELLFQPAHSIIDQSLHAKLQGYTTNGDGFGIGWYGDSTTPAVYKSTHPAWNDRDLHEIAGQIRTPLLFAHIRASSGTPVQRSNCHPFRYGRWLWMHNGSLAGFQEMKRDLMMAVDPSLFAETRDRPAPRPCSSWPLPSVCRKTHPTRSPARSASSKSATATE